ncbi:MAG TPA: DUF5989 family protein [Methylomirabilota bacterium]|nr:DUF5989 family protein [Methylomirabilota bacterium]
MIAFRGLVSSAAELVYFLWTRKLWWMIPMVIVMLLFSGLLLLASVPVVGPFIYSLF